jgi:uncharacterized membrane protein YqiK
MQKEVVKSDQGVWIAQRVADAAVKKAEGEASSVKIQATAEAERVKVISGADAERTKLIANADAEKIKALANAEAQKIEVEGRAEAEKILAIGKSNAESYKLSVEAMGGDNFTKLKVTEVIGTQGVKIIPEVLITGGVSDGSNGAISGLLGMQILEEVMEKKRKEVDSKKAD